MYQKNYSIEALRFIFISVLCFFHCKNLLPSVGRAYLVVEFFFVLSGFLMYRSFNRHPEIGVIDYTIKKVKLFFVPCLITSFLIMCLDRKHYLYISEFTTDELLNKYFSHIPEFLFCQSIGITAIEKINLPVWYLSVLIFGGAIIYSMLRNCGHKTISLYFPILCIMGFSYVFGGGAQSLGRGIQIPGFPILMIRGISDMTLGVMTASFLEKKGNVLSAHHSLVNVAGGIALLGFCMMLFSTTQVDFLALIFVPVIVCTSFVFGNMFQKIFVIPFWGILGQLSLYMFIIHLFVINVYYIIIGYEIIQIIPLPILSALYLVVVMFSAIILKRVSDYINSKLFD